MQDSASNTQTPKNTLFEVFFDGDCPLCEKEINLLRWMDRKRVLRFTDIADERFDPTPLGVDLNTLMARIHGRGSDGKLIEGVEVFRQLYTGVGFGPLVQLTRLPGIAPLLDAAYVVFARNRLKWTGRCTDTCQVTTPTPLRS